MIDIAEDKDVYDGLYVGEIVAFLEDNDEGPFDFVLAADVLPYSRNRGAAFHRRRRSAEAERYLRFLDRNADRGRRHLCRRPEPAFPPCPALSACRTRRDRFHGSGHGTKSTCATRNEAPSPGHLVVAKKGLALDLRPAKGHALAAKTSPSPKQHARTARNPPHLRDHLPSGRRQDDADRTPAEGVWRHSARRSGPGARRTAADAIGLDGDRTKARHLRHLLGDDIRARRADLQPARYARSTPISPKTPTAR